MSMNEKALQALLNACDDREHVGGRLYRFTFEESFVDTVIIAQQTAKGWRVLEVTNDD